MKLKVTLVAAMAVALGLGVSTASAQSNRPLSAAERVEPGVGFGCGGGKQWIMENRVARCKNPDTWDRITGQSSEYVLEYNGNGQPLVSLVVKYERSRIPLVWKVMGGNGYEYHDAGCDLAGVGTRCFYTATTERIPGGSSASMTLNWMAFLQPEARRNMASYMGLKFADVWRAQASRRCVIDSELPVYGFNNRDEFGDYRATVAASGRVEVTRQENSIMFFRATRGIKVIAAGRSGPQISDSGRWRILSHGVNFSNQNAGIVDGSAFGYGLMEVPLCSPW